MNPIPLSLVDDTTRARDRKKYGDLTLLKNSILSVGLIHPIVLSFRSDGKYDLVAGGRRTAALRELGIKELHHGSTLDPQKIGFVWASEVPDHIRKNAELDENLYRLDMDWIDNIMLIADVHLAKKRLDLTWGTEATAAVLGPGYGRTKVQLALKCAKLLREGDKEMLACTSFSDAINLSTKRKEEEALAALSARALPKTGVFSGIQVAAPGIKPQPPAPATSSTFLSTLSDGPDFDAAPVVDLGKVSVQSQAGPVQREPAIEVPLSRMFICANSILSDYGTPPGYLSTLPDSSFDHIVTDIPYGIDMDNLDEEFVKDVAAEHSVEGNIDLMLPFLTQAYRLVRPGGFCVFFYDLDHHEKLQAWAAQVGWKVQRWPFIATKSSPCRNQSAAYNLTKNYEVAMFLRRDERTVLRRAQSTSWKTYDFRSESRLYNNPFAKPFALWKDIYDMVAFPGQSVLDPFAGEMSACRAAANCGLVPYGVEVKQEHFLRGLEHMKGAYALIHKSNCIFT